MHFDTDRAGLDHLWPTVGRFNEEDIRIGWIRNSLHLAEIALTENVGREIRANAELEIVSGPSGWPFDSAGNLPELLPAEVFEQELRPAGAGAGSAPRAK
jgi:hypothetical protein